MRVTAGRHTASSAPPPGLSAVQKRRAEQLTSLFENDSPTLDYGYAKHLHDGRGITAGRAGFTSGTDDMFEVVAAYAKQKPNNPLSRYLPALKALHRLPAGAAGRSSTSGLDGLTHAWAEASKDSAFRAVQDRVVDRLYYSPAMKHANALGLRTALARAQLYDAIIQHGDGKDPDGLRAIIATATKTAGGTPKSGVAEAKWLSAFLEARRAVLTHAHGSATRKEWRKSVDRVGVYEDLLKAKNFELRGPIHVKHGDVAGLVR